MADKVWKAAERRVAKLFGTERVPLSGGNDKRTRSDTLHETLFIEVKHSKQHAHVSVWYATLKLAKREGKTPVVVLAEKRRQRLFAIVPLEQFYLLELAGELGSPPVLRRGL